MNDSQKNFTFDKEISEQSNCSNRINYYSAFCDRIEFQISEVSVSDLFVFYGVFNLFWRFAVDLVEYLCLGLGERLGLGECLVSGFE
jgi:hypothetical protein